MLVYMWIFCEFWNKFEYSMPFGFNQSIYYAFLYVLGIATSTGMCLSRNLEYVGQEVQVSI